MATYVYDITTDLSDQAIYPHVIHQDCIDAGVTGVTNVSANPKGNANKVIVTADSGQQAAIDAVIAAYDPADGIDTSEDWFAFTLTPPHAAGVSDQTWLAGCPLEITRIEVTAMGVVDTGDYPINIRAGADESNFAGMALVGTCTLTAGNLQNNETVIGTPHAVAKGEHVVAELGTITGTWATELNIMVQVFYKRTG